MISLIRLSGVMLMLISINACKKEADNVSKVVDGSGNVYVDAVLIGTQEWMVENLKTDKYSNGDEIGTTAQDISAESTPRYQWAYGGDESNVATYGRLYTWYAATDNRNICPSGWHVPTDDDWTTLTTFLGGEDAAGGKLKEVGTDHWLTLNVGATNELNFNALPGGFRFSTGNFGYLGDRGFWWTSVEDTMLRGYYRYMAGIFGFVGRDVTNKQYGFSVRCIKDK
jgi:uncharacterized protein (TIGR02145 family)